MLYSILACPTLKYNKKKLYNKDYYNSDLGRNAHQPFAIRSPNRKGLANRLTNGW